MPPNIVCITIDDMGWSDLGCYGSRFYETPNIDALANRGTRFTDAYASAPVCSPTRASLQSGQYPSRVGITNWIAGRSTGKLLDPEYLEHLPEDVTSIADALSAGGYTTWHVGKWHLGGEKDSAVPTERGYDENIAGSRFGHPVNGFFSPYDLPNLSNGPDGEYLTDRLTDEAIELFADHDGEDPFFLNMSYYSVHTPIQAKEETVKRFERKREALGLDDQKEFEVGEAFPFEQAKNSRVVRRLVQSDPTYAAMIQHLDENIGRLLDALETKGIAENTVVIFTSDNGGLATIEGAPTCNKPLSEGKGWMFEGGNRVPLIVDWPGVTGSGEICETPATTPDLYATVLDAAGVAPPTDQTIDGESLRPLFNGRSLDRDAIFWHYPHYGNQGGTPAGAIRTERWKLIEFYEDNRAVLFDLENDVSEAHDISEYQDDRVDELRERLDVWRDEVGANMPQTNLDFEPWDDRLGPGRPSDNH